MQEHDKAGGGKQFREPSQAVPAGCRETVSHRDRWPRLPGIIWQIEPGTQFVPAVVLESDFFTRRHVHCPFCPLSGGPFRRCMVQEILDRLAKLLGPFCMWPMAGPQVHALGTISATSLRLAADRRASRPNPSRPRASGIHV